MVLLIVTRLREGVLVADITHGARQRQITLDDPTTLTQMLRATRDTTSWRVTRVVDFADMNRIAKKQTTRTPARTGIILNI